MEPTSAPPRPNRWRKRLMAVLAIAVVAVASIFFSIPWMVNWPFIKDRLAREVNVIFAPSKVSFDSISVSWFGPSSVRGLELIDGENRRVVTAPRATLDWNLFQILFTRPKVANVVLEDGRADIVRETNGKINLIESIRPILVPRPERTVVIRLQHGNVKVRPSPEARSLVDDPADVLLDFAAYPGPITWDLKFSRVKSGESPSNLDLGGKLERVAAEGSELPDFELHLASKRWAVSHGQTGSAVSGTIDANLEARRRQGHWSSNGQATVENFAADANAIDGHNPDFRLSKTQASWKVLDSPEGWDTTVRVEAPFATLDAQGIMTGTLEEKLVLALNAELSNVDLPDALESEPSRPSREPLKTSMTLAYDAKADRLDLSGLDLAIPLVRVRGEGSVAGLTSKRTVDLRGTLEPDWDALQKQLAEKVEPRARLAGRSKGWAITGSIPSLQVSDWSRTLEGEAGIELDLLDVFGMRLSRTAFVGRYRGGALTIDPIDSTLNGGALHLEPSLATDSSGRRELRLNSKSFLTDAEVNEEVSHRVLSYVAPMLDQATRVSGRVSVAISDAAFPLDSLSAASKPRVEGEVSFDQVEFAPGPFADMILGTLIQERKAKLVLNEPVSLSIVDGRVYQEGMAIPLGKFAEIGMDGWVGFDRTLELTASITLTPDKSTTNPPLANSIFRGTRVAIPIHGTFDDPKLDTRALGQNFKDLGAGLLSRTLSSATGGIIPDVETLKNLFGGPRNGDQMEAPPSAPRMRVTPEERRARRQERRLERMRKRGEIP